MQCVGGIAGASGIIVPSVRWEKAYSLWDTGSLAQHKEMCAERGYFSLGIALLIPYRQQRSGLGWDSGWGVLTPT